MLNPNCRVCQSRSLEKVLETPPLPEYIWPVSSPELAALSPCDVYRCQECHHIQLQSFTDEKLSSFYVHGSFVEENMQAKELRLNRILKLLGNSFFVGKKILDVGGGNNPFVKLLKPFTEDIFVSDFDVSRETEQICNGKVYLGKFEEVKIGESNFDIILTFHSMEHMNQPALVVQKMKSLLSPQGTLVVEVPNFLHVVDKMPYYSIFHQHISMFTKHSLIGLFHRHGFRLDHVIVEDSVLFMTFRHSDDNLPIKTEDTSRFALGQFSEKMKFLGHKIEAILLDEKPSRLSVYGAGGSSALFIHQLPVIREKLRLCFDRDPSKQVKFVSGTTVQIEGPEKIGKSDFVVFLSNQIREIFRAELRCPVISVEEILYQFGGN